MVADTLMLQCKEKTGGGEREGEHAREQCRQGLWRDPS